MIYKDELGTIAVNDGGEIFFKGTWGFNRTDTSSAETGKDDWFTGTVTDRKKLLSLLQKIEKNAEEMNRLRIEAEQLNQKIVDVRNKLEKRIQKNFQKAEKLVSMVDVQKLVKDFEQKLFANQTFESKRWPKEGDLGGSYYTEYDGTGHIDIELFNEICEKRYRAELRDARELLKPYNKSLQGTGIELDVLAEARLTDKTAEVYPCISLGGPTINQARFNQAIPLDIFKKLQKVLKV